MAASAAARGRWPTSFGRMPPVPAYRDRMAVAGADVCSRGWVAVVLDAGGRFLDAGTFDTIRGLLVRWAGVATIAVDIPIGFPVSGLRRADQEAARFIGPRRSSVFATPPRPVLEADNYTAARRVAAELWGRGVSAQAYALRKRVLEVDAVAFHDPRVIEAHPEVTFRAMASRPIASPKRSWNGQMTRRRILADAGIVLPDRLRHAGDVPVDDVLDAAACAWTALRFSRGGARSLPDPPETDLHGRPMAIWW